MVGRKAIDESADHLNANSLGLVQPLPGHTAEELIR